MGKKLAIVSFRVPTETKLEGESMAQVLGVTPSRLARSLYERAITENRKPCLQGRCGRLVEHSERLHELAVDAVADGKIDIAERAELTQVESAILNDLWNGEDAA